MVLMSSQTMQVSGSVGRAVDPAGPTLNLYPDGASYALRGLGTADFSNRTSEDDRIPLGQIGQLEVLDGPESEEPCDQERREPLPFGVVVPYHRVVVATAARDVVLGGGQLGLELQESCPPVIHLMLTHLHLDHIQGLMFFPPCFQEQSQITVWGPASPESSLEERVGRYISAPLSPVEDMEMLLSKMYKTKTNQDFLNAMSGK